MSFVGKSITERERNTRYKRDVKGFDGFPKIFKKNLDYSRPDRNFFRDYINENLPLPEEDEITVDLVTNMIFDEHIDPERLCIDLTPFLDEDKEKAMKFTAELWKQLLLSQKEINGIPKGIQLKRSKVHWKDVDLSTPHLVIGRERLRNKPNRRNIGMDNRRFNCMKGRKKSHIKGKAIRK